jgi:hypothetical protein
VLECEDCLAEAVAAALREAVAEEREACARLHESINADCDRDRIGRGDNGWCGCGAMGAIIEYRDAIRACGSHKQEEEKR